MMALYVNGFESAILITARKKKYRDEPNHRDEPRLLTKDMLIIIITANAGLFE